MSATAQYNLEDQRRMSLARNYFAWQSRLVLPALGRRVIEAGAGIGNFTGALLDRELVIAVDNEPECIAALLTRYPNRSNLRAFVRELNARSVQELGSLALDSCVCLNVLEHIEEDAAALRAIHSVLSEGGIVVLLVPAFPSLFGPIDRNLGHVRRYTRGGLKALARVSGFRIRTLRHVNVLGFFGWWWNARVRRREEQSATQIALFDRFAPWLERLERVVRPPFGLSLLAVLERR